jgi:hypothetical protein
MDGDGLPWFAIVDQLVSPRKTLQTTAGFTRFPAT